MLLNQRIAWDNHQNQIVPLLPVIKTEYEFVDVKTDEVLARRITVGSRVFPHAHGLVGFKFWLNLEPCMPNKEGNSKFMSDIKKAGIPGTVYLFNGL